MTQQVLIADDQGIVKYGLSLIIKELIPDAVVSETNDFDKTVRAIRKQRYDLLIVDINVSGGNNIEMIDLVRAEQPQLKIFIFSAYNEQLYAPRYLQAGANGYLHKHATRSEIRNALESVLYRGYYISEQVKKYLMEDMVTSKRNSKNPLTRLSNREMEVARLLVEGHVLIKISGMLNIHISTASTYKNRIFEKLRVSNFVELVDQFRLYDNTAPQYAKV